MEIPDEVREEMTFHLIDHVDRLLEVALIGYAPIAPTDNPPPNTVADGIEAQVDAPA